METKFQLSEVVGTSWKAVKSQIWVLVGLFVAYTIIAGIIQTFIMPSQPQAGMNIFTPRLGIGWLVSLVISGLFILGYLKNLFQTLDGQEPQFSAYGQQARKLLTYILSYFLFALIVGIGLVLFIIPGIYLAIRLQFFPAFIVEENEGIVESLKMSWSITRGNVGKLFLLGVVMFALILLGLVVLLIGVFVAIPLVYMMYCYTFRKLYPNPLQAGMEQAAV